MNQVMNTARIELADADAQVATLAGFAPLAGLRVGLVTNPSGADREGRSSIDLLDRAPNVNQVRLFSPEHGIRGDQDREGVEGERRTNLLWRAVAQAPAGWAHIPAGMLGTLLQDIKDKTPFETLKKRLRAQAEMRV